MSEQTNCTCIYCAEITGYEKGCDIIECEWCEECFNESDVTGDEQPPKDGK